MTVRHMDFDTPSGAEPKYSGTFNLGGRSWKIRDRDDVPFELIKRLMGQAPVADDASDEEKAVAAREVVLQTGPFFEQTIVPEEVQDFIAMMNDPQSALTVGKLRPVMEYVSEVVFSDEAERPTKRPKPSRRGPSATGATSKGSSSSRGTAPKASTG
jgi:hypothetical protein